MSLKLTNGEAFAVASDQADLIEGAHGAGILYVFDEAKSISDAIFDSAEGAFAGKGLALALATSTPGTPSGRFYEIHQRKGGYEDWTARHVKLEEMITAGRQDPAWVEQRKQQWGERSSIYVNRVLGEFAAPDEDGIIPLSWIEKANERWLALKDSGQMPTKADVIGVDVARNRESSQVIADVVLGVHRRQVLVVLER